MGLMDSLGGAAELLGAFTGKQSGLMGTLASVIQRRPSGLGGLLQQFRQRGMDSHVSSWIGTGENHSIGPEQLEQGMGSDTLDQVARESGMPKHEARTELSRLFPQVVDRLTPHGQLNEQEAHQGLGSLLSKITGR